MSRFTNTVLSLLVVSPALVLCSSPVPNIFGAGKFVSGLGVHDEKVSRSPSAHGNDVKILPRQATCGEGIGSCADGFCCSAAGNCGQTSDYCLAPNCQLNYGPACDGNIGPTSGADTSGVDRPSVGDVAYGGVGISKCVTPGTVAVTYDDGPSEFTTDLLDKLKGYNAQVTFFVVGNNGGRGAINDRTMKWPGILERMVNEGHQIASHTWTHENSTLLDDDHMMEQMVWNEVAINDVLGYFPTYMRPPYDECSPVCEAAMEKLGYHIIYHDIDTNDWMYDDATEIQNSKDTWDASIGPSNPETDSFLSLEHDIFYQSVYNLTDYIFTSLQQKGYKSVTVGDCLADPKENWYRTGPAASS